MHRCPAVPTALKTIALTAMSISALGVRIIPLFPPSSNKYFPKRAATVVATFLPIATLPVALTNFIVLSEAIACPTVASPITTCDKNSGTGSPYSSTASLKIFSHKMAESGVFSLGFHITLFPQTIANAKFQAQTATGKLKAEMTAIGPNGCQTSINLWPGRSLGMVNP